VVEVSGELYDREFIEHTIISEFTRRAHHYLPTNLLPDDGQRLEWLALMQHHGAPTRLLDWTRSPYIAAYFALEEAAKYAAVWAIQSFWLFRTSVKALKKADPECTLPDDVGFLSDDYRKAVVSNAHPGVFPIEPDHLNERITVQQGMFMYPGAVAEGFTENLNSYVNLVGDEEFRRNVVLIRLSKRMRTDALDDLRRSNIHRASLFPGLDGFAGSLKYAASVWTDEEYMMRAALREPRTQKSKMR
jgi:hypothetical protein